MIHLLKYGNTNTFYISNGHSGILVDTDWAWTLSAFYKAIKSRDIKIEDIHYLIITHYHPDHMGLASELVYTPGHSDDSISIILDEGIAIVGDLDPVDSVLAYNDNAVLKNSWNKILGHNLKVVFYGHANERDVSELISIDDL